MNELPRRKLCELVAAQGRSVWEDPRRCRALLEEANRMQAEQLRVGKEAADAIKNLGLKLEIKSF